MRLSFISDIKNAKKWNWFDLLDQKAGMELLSREKLSTLQPMGGTVRFAVQSLLESGVDFVGYAFVANEETGRVWYDDARSEIVEETYVDDDGLPSEITDDEDEVHDAYGADDPRRSQEWRVWREIRNGLGKEGKEGKEAFVMYGVKPCRTGVPKLHLRSYLKEDFFEPGFTALGNFPVFTEKISDVILSTSEAKIVSPATAPAGEEAKLNFGMIPVDKVYIVKLRRKEGWSSCHP